VQLPMPAKYAAESIRLVHDGIEIPF